MIFSSQNLNRLRRLEGEHQQISVLRSQVNSQGKQLEISQSFSDFIENISFEWMKKFIAQLENWIDGVSVLYLTRLQSIQQGEWSSCAEKNHSAFLLGLSQFLKSTSYTVSASLSNLNSLYLTIPKPESFEPSIKLQQKVSPKQQSYLTKIKSLSIDSCKSQGESRYQGRSRSKSKGKKLSFFKDITNKKSSNSNLFDTFTKKSNSDALNKTVVKKNIHRNQLTGDFHAIQKSHFNGSHSLTTSKFQGRKQKTVDEIKEKMQKRISSTCTSEFFNRTNQLQENKLSQTVQGVATNNEVKQPSSLKNFCSQKSVHKEENDKRIQVEQILSQQSQKTCDLLMKIEQRISGQISQLIKENTAQSRDKMVTLKENSSQQKNHQHSEAKINLVNLQKQKDAPKEVKCIERQSLHQKETKNSSIIAKNDKSVIRSNKKHPSNGNIRSPTHSGRQKIDKKKANESLKAPAIKVVKNCPEEQMSSCHSINQSQELEVIDTVQQSRSQLEKGENKSSKENFYQLQQKKLHGEMIEALKKFDTATQKLTLPVNEAFQALFSESYIRYAHANDFKLNQSVTKFIETNSHEQITKKCPTEISKFLEESITKMEKMIQIKCPTEKKQKIKDYVKCCCECISSTVLGQDIIKDAATLGRIDSKIGKLVREIQQP